MLPEEILNYYF